MSWWSRCARKRSPILSAEGYRQAINSNDKDALSEFVWLKDDQAGSVNADVDYQPEKVFLSHRGPDTKYSLVLPLAGVLKDLYQVSCFVDMLPTNVELRAKTENKVDVLRNSLWSCELVLIFLSPRFHESKWCLRELYTALYRREECQEEKCQGEKCPTSVTVHIVFCGISPNVCDTMPEYKGLNLGKGFGSGLKTQRGLAAWVVPEIAEQHLGVDVLLPTTIKLIKGDTIQLTDEANTKWKNHSRVIRRTRWVQRIVLIAAFAVVSGFLASIIVVFGSQEKSAPTFAPTISPVPTSAPTVAPVSWDEVWTMNAPLYTALFGVSLDVSDDASVLLVGSMGRVFCFRRSNTTSYTYELDEISSGVGQSFGMSLSLSSSGNYAAISDPHRVSSSSSTGTLQVIHYTGRSWRLLGYPWKTQYGPTSVDEFLHGDYVSIARGTGDVIAIGDSDNDIVESIHLNQNDWVQRSPLALDKSNFGWAVDLSEGGTVLAVGARDARAGGGLVAVYEWNTTTWVPRGEPILGDSNNRFGHAVKLSADGIVLAASANFNFDGGRFGGNVRVFEWDGIQWNQRGNDIVGYRSDGDLEFGKSIAMNSDGTRIVVASPYWNSQGRVFLYAWTGWQWVERGEVITAEESAEFGNSVALSADGNLLLVGDPYGNYGNGYVKLFQANSMESESASQPQEEISAGNATRDSSRVTPPTLLPSEGQSTLIDEKANATRASAITAFVQSSVSVWPLSYPGNSSTYERALQWLIDDDPARIEHTNTLQLMQRFVLVSWCLQWLDSSSTAADGWMKVSHECDWDWDIQCQTTESGRCITSIAKVNQGITGSLPEVLGHLTALADLSLSGNRLTGSVPSSLVTLKNLSLSRNLLTGSIPSSLLSLTSLSLSLNRLTGSIPSSLLALTHLNLQYNFLTGRLPSELGSMSALRWLDLANNQLTGPIPSELTNLQSLEYVLLYGNQLTGSNPFCQLDLTITSVRSIIADCGSLECPCCSSCCPSSFHRSPYKFCDYYNHTANGWVS